MSDPWDYFELMRDFQAVEQFVVLSVPISEIILTADKDSQVGSTANHARIFLQKLPRAVGVKVVRASTKDLPKPVWVLLRKSVGPMHGARYNRNDAKQLRILES